MYESLILAAVSRGIRRVRNTSEKAFSEHGEDKKFRARAAALLVVVANWR